jgi:hypothetical protein
MRKPVIVGDDLLRDAIRTLQEYADSHDQEDRFSLPHLRRIRRIVKQLGIRRAVALRNTGWGRELQRGKRA